MFTRFELHLKFLKFCFYYFLARIVHYDFMNSQLSRDYYYYYNILVDLNSTIITSYL